MTKARLFFIGISLLFLVGCAAARQDNTLLENASPDTSAMELYIYDGHTATRKFLYDSEEEKEILRALASVPVQKAEDHTLADVMLPIYGIRIGGKDEQDVQAAWSDGYWITKEGEVYDLDHDFEALAAEYDWQDPDTWETISVLPCARFLCEDGDGWYAPLLTPARELLAPEDISLRLVSQTGDSVTVSFSNEGDEEWTYGEYFSLQVLLDDVWYEIPPMPGEHGFADIASILPPGRTQEETYDLTMYGKLPSGTYRLVTEGLSAGFEL